MPTTTALRILKIQLEASLCYHFQNRSDPRFASQVHPLACKIRQVRGLIAARDKQCLAQSNVSNNLQEITA